MLFASYRIDLSQNSRINALGGLSFTIKDIDNGLDIYNFGSNPAWFSQVDTVEWLKVSPYSGNSWGDYKKKFDPEGEHNYNLSSLWSRALDKNNKFLGRAAYNYIRRSNVFGVLEYEPYSGKGYFVADTAIENATFNGPAVGFIYSFNIFSKLLAGIDCNYQILNGQRNGYSHTLSLFRKISAELGLAYKVKDNFIVGGTFGLIDSKEEMDSQSDGSDIEVLLFKGEQTFLQEIVQNRSAKEKEKGKTMSLHSQIKGEGGIWELAVKGNYSSFSKSLLKPFKSLLESNFGYSYFEHLDFQGIVRWFPSPDLTFGFSTGYINNYSWTKCESTTDNIVLQWKWNNEQIFGALGVSYYLKNLRLLIGTEYKFSQISADSSKYIDNLFFNDNSNEHEVKAGAELEAFTNLFFRTGYYYTASRIDFRFGGTKMRQNIITAGFGIRMLSVEIDMMLRYGKLSFQERRDSKRTLLEFSTTFKLLEF